MSKSLADLRANPPTSRPERMRTICLVPHLVARVQGLTEELAALPLPSVSVDEDGEREGPPRKSAKSDAEVRADQIQAELSEALAEVEQHEGELRLRASWTDGEWRRWVDENPPRKKDEPGYDRDLRIGQMATGGLAMVFCNTDALMDALAGFAHTWRDERLNPDDWATLFEPVVSNGDKAVLAAAVIGMYEGSTDFQQWRSALSANLKKLNDSERSTAPTPVRAVSTAGSRGRSTGGTTKKANK